MRRIYLDNNATTQVDPRVVAEMLPYFAESFGNPHSDSHAYGWEASNAVKRSRKQIAELIDADAREIVFTSGATESCNIVLRGVCRRTNSRRKKVVTVATEHACVLETCNALRDEGMEVVVVPVDRSGLVELEVLRRVIDSNTLIVSVMLANNEIGVIQPIEEIAPLCQASGTLLHSDATQAVGKIPVSVRTLGVDFMSCSAHKLYGPKGIGALYMRWGISHVIDPPTTGGSQESGIRPGTLPVPLVVGFGTAAKIAHAELDQDMLHVSQLTDQLYERLKASASDMQVYGHDSRRLPGNLNVGFPGVSGEAIIERVGTRLAISNGAACSSTASAPSHVLTAIDPTGSSANHCVRMGIGRFNSQDEIESAAAILVAAIDS